MPDMPQIQRLLRILPWFESGQRLTTLEIIERFQSRYEEVMPLRTVQRDLNAISAAGIPLQVEKVSRNQNAWWLDTRARHFLPTFLLTNEYLAALILKANLTVFKSTSFQKEIDSLLQKISQLVPDEVFDAQESFDIFDQYAVGEFDYSGLKINIETIFQAIRERRPCEVTYQGLSSNKPLTYVVTPARMFQYGGALYLVAYTHLHKTFLSLKLSRLHNLRMTDEVDRVMPAFDLKTFREGRFGLFPGEKIEKVVLQFDQDAAPHIIGRQWHPSQKIEEKDSGTVTLTMKVGITPELESWILGWMPMVKIIQPKKWTLKTGQWLRSNPPAGGLPEPQQLGDRRT